MVAKAIRPVGARACAVAELGVALGAVGGGLVGSMLAEGVDELDSAGVALTRGTCVGPGTIVDAAAVEAVRAAGIRST